jgi:hypothetical protein
MAISFLLQIGDTRYVLRPKSCTAMSPVQQVMNTLDILDETQLDGQGVISR